MLNLACKFQQLKSYFNTVYVVIFVVVLFSGILGGSKSLREFQLQYKAIYSNDNITKSQN